MAEVAGVVIATLLMLVAVATPSTGVVSVGEVANTNEPLPVSSVTAVARLALLGVARKVATPVPRPVRAEAGYPVQLVSVPALGVPMLGVVSVGEPENTTLPPLPVVPLTAVPAIAAMVVVIAVVPLPVTSPDKVIVWLVYSTVPPVPKLMVPLPVMVMPLTVVAVSVPTEAVVAVRVENACVPVNVCPASVRATVALVDGNVMVVPSVPVSVIVLLTVSVLAEAIVSVPVVEVIVRPL